MSDTLYRHWAMLQQVPRAPWKVTVSDLHERLSGMGYDVTRRSVERDLNKLSGVFGLQSDGHKPAGWSYARGVQLMDIPGMDPHAAIAFRLAEQHLSHQLPRSSLKALEQHFKRARAVLGALRKEGLPAWAEKVRVVPRGQRLLPPKVSASVLGAVHDALLHGRCLDVTYKNASGELKQGELHPLGLVYRDATGVLVATWTGFSDARSYVLHRLESARMNDHVRAVPQGFSLDDYVDAGNASFVLDKRPVKLVLRVAKAAAPTLLETPLAEAQKVVAEDEGWVRVEVTVPADTRALRAFLLGFGPMLEVLQPKRVRDEMRSAAEEIGALYRER